MFTRSYKIMRIAGIPVGVQPLWIVIVALITWTLGDQYYPDRVAGIAPLAAYALGFASALLLFASIVAHEFGHALTARRYGVAVEGIDLWLLGGVAKMRGEAHRPGDELRYALAGPLVTLVVAAVFGAAAILLPSATPRAVSALVEYQVYVNVLILGFNLLPAFPLDGGRVTRALLWRRSGDLQKATLTAARGGRLFGWFLIAVGVFDAMAGVAGGVWMSVIGAFIVMAAAAETRHVQLAVAFAGVHAGDLMTAPAITISVDASAEVAAEFFRAYRVTALPVTSMGRAVGLLTVDTLEALPHETWPETRVGEICDRDPELLVEPGEDVLQVVERGAFIRDGRAVVVGRDGAAAGILSITDVQRALRMRALHVT